jgi:predicted  nucleic acid-binding Zn-ribbon protein
MTLLSDAKRDAPTVPDNTCPIIDKIQKGIEDLVTDRNSALEDVRQANSELRDSSQYWYNVAKEMQERIDALESEVSELEEENQELRQQLERTEQAA